MKALTFTKERAAYKARRLLDLGMPDGRALRSYTANDCHAAGGWLRTLSRRIRDGWDKGQVDRTGRRTVGEIYSEAMLELLFYNHYRQELELAKVRDGVQPGDEFDGR